MADDTENPVFQIQRMYLKDLSLEQPNAPQILEQTQQKKQSTLGQLNALKEKITVQQQVIKSTSSELRYIETGVKKTATDVELSQAELARLKAEYAKLIYAASKTTSSYNRIMFLFAAESFNEFMLRLRYVRQYAEVRRQQVSSILRSYDAGAAIMEVKCNATRAARTPFVAETAGAGPSMDRSLR